MRADSIRRSAKWIFLLAVAVVAVIGIHNALTAPEGPPGRSSPTAKRFETFEEQLPGLDPGPYIRMSAFGDLKVREVPDYLIIEGKTDSSIVAVIDEKTILVHADEHGVAQLPDGRKLNFDIFAHGVMKPGGEPAWFDVRDPISLAPVEDPEWIERRVPVPTDRRIQFLAHFQVEGGATPSVIQAWLFDTRTNVKVGKSRSFFSQREGELLIPGDLLVWHDTPLKLVVECRFGEPEIVPLSMEPGDVAKFHNGQFQFQTIHTGNGQIWGYSENRVRLFEANSPFDYLLARLDPDSEKWLQQSLIGFGHELWGVKELSQIADDGYLLYNFYPPKKPAQLQLVHYPQRIRVVFDVNGLPGMPNGRRETKDLLDVRIPILNPDQSFSPSLWLPVALQFAQVENKSASLSPFSVGWTSYGGLAPPNFTIKLDDEMTPRQLLMRMEEATNLTAHIDSKDHTIEFRPTSNDPWYRRAWDWIRSR